MRIKSVDSEELILTEGSMLIASAKKSENREAFFHDRELMTYEQLTNKYAPLIPHYMSMYILASSDRIMITKMIDTTSTAIYSVAYTVASVIQILWTSIEASLSPWIYERLDVQDEESVRKTSGQIMLTFAVFCLGCTLFAPEIMTILAPDSYKAGIYAIPAIAGGVYFTAVYSLYMRIELFYKKTTFATVASTIAAVSNIILNYIFIKLFGFVAAGYTTMVCYALL